MREEIKHLVSANEYFPFLFIQYLQKKTDSLNTEAVNKIELK